MSMKQLIVALLAVAGIVGLGYLSYYIFVIQLKMPLWAWLIC